MYFTSLVYIFFYTFSNLETGHHRNQKTASSAIILGLQPQRLQIRLFQFYSLGSILVTCPSQLRYLPMTLNLRVPHPSLSTEVSGGGRGKNMLNKNPVASHRPASFLLGLQPVWPFHNTELQNDPRRTYYKGGVCAGGAIFQLQVTLFGFLQATIVT